MSAEETLFDRSGIRITTTRATIGGKTYSMANLTSVTMSRTPANRRTGIILCCVAAMITLAGLANGSAEGTIFGLILLAAGWFAAKTPRDRFHVMLGSASGEGEALVSTDRGFIEGIVEAINDAMVRRG